MAPQNLRRTKAGSSSRDVSGSRSASNGRSGGGDGVHMNNFSCIKKWNDAAKLERVIKCECKLVCKYWTSFTPGNPGRRFIACPYYYNGGGCGFWSWFDDPLDSTAIGLISVMKEELVEMRNTMAVKDSLIEGYETEIRRSHDQIGKLEDEIELAKMKATSALEEIKKLKSEKQNVHDVGDKRSFLVVVVFVVVVLYLSKTLGGI